MYKFYIEKDFKNQKEFEEWIWEEVRTGYKLKSIKAFGYIPDLKNSEQRAVEPDPKPFIAEQIIFESDKKMLEDWIKYKKLGEGSSF